MNVDLLSLPIMFGPHIIVLCISGVKRNIEFYTMLMTADINIFDICGRYGFFFNVT